MSKTILKDRKIFIFSLIVASTTVIAGILHLQMAPGSLSHNLGEGILFLVGGIVQVFWAIPVVKRWGRIWQIIGIAGTAVFIALWYASRIHLIPEGDILGGGASHEQPREFPRGNFTGGEPQGGLPRGSGMRGGFMLPQIEIFQIAFIVLYAVYGKIIYRKK